MAYLNTPLSERVRPQTLNEVIGQSHLIGPEGILTRLIAQTTLPSILFWGPPGVGKTTIAKLLAQAVKRPYYELSAIQAGVKDLREVIQRSQGLFPPILFIDEIHRFNKAQQDALLNAVETGTITLIGATTENPSFEVNNALLSRCQVLVLKPLDKGALIQIAEQALSKDVLLSAKQLTIVEQEALIALSGGDARKLLNLLEIIGQILPEGTKTIDNAWVKKAAQQLTLRYDKLGETHYDVISAMIKSVRGSDPNAAVYYLARMLNGGEDPLFIARRLIILASEDIGNAQPEALTLAVSCFEACHKIGMPECRIVLAQCVTFLASAPKSNASYLAIEKAYEIVNQTANLEVPLHLRNTPTALMKELGYGKDYQYAHNHQNAFIDLEYLPKAIAGTTIYQPTAYGAESAIKNRLKQLWDKKYYNVSNEHNDTQSLG